MPNSFSPLLNIIKTPRDYRTLHAPVRRTRIMKAMVREFAEFLLRGSMTRGMTITIKSEQVTKDNTRHCARHSFAVNLLNNGTNIKTVASLLGHAGLKHTEKYTRAVDSLKREAISAR